MAKTSNWEPVSSFPLVRMSKCLSELFSSTWFWFCLWIFQVSCHISNYKTFWICSKNWVIQFISLSWLLVITERKTFFFFFLNLPFLGLWYICRGAKKKGNLFFALLHLSNWISKCSMTLQGHGNLSVKNW